LSAAVPPVVILCGGRGTRLQEHTRSIPKALVEIGGKPILWHVIQIYAAQAFDRFLLATGYMSEQIKEWAEAQEWPAGVSVQSVDTGIETPTGGRISKLRERLSDGTFCATYADGVADVNLQEALSFHRARGALATMTVVQARLQFGVAELDGDDRVNEFVEKPRTQHWVNGGFFCFEPGVFDYLTESSVLEREPLEDLAAQGQLSAFKHTGFWECMDTYKDAVELNDLWAQERPPWKIWA
jgi:glucose-1-phosphate cytidylyltransferase